MARKFDLTLAHISDLHFTSKMAWPIEESTDDKNTSWGSSLLELHDDLVASKPDGILVTGDIADNPVWDLKDNGLELAWGHALRFLTCICNTLYPGEHDLSTRLFIIPGNHDCKVLGNVNKEQLERLSESVPFRTSRFLLSIATRYLCYRHGIGDRYADFSAAFSTRLRESFQSVPTDLVRFREIFGPFMQHRALQDLGVFVFCLNSNLESDSFLNLAQGAIAPAEARQLRTTADTWRKAYSTYSAAYRIALIHHHPMLMPSAEGVGGITERDQFHLLRNAGSFLQVCVEQDVDLVLHGHKHVPGHSVVSFPAPEAPNEFEHLINVVGAGSVIYPFEGSCSYNLIRRSYDGQWQLEVRERRHRENGLSSYGTKGEPKVLVSRERHRRRTFFATMRPIRIRRAEVVAHIDETGDMDARFYVMGITPTDRESRNEFPVAFGNESSRATFIADGFKDVDARENVVKGSIPLEPAAGRNSPVNALYRVIGVGIYTLSGEYCRLYKKTAEEHFSLGTRGEKSYDELMADVYFPEEFPPLEPTIQVLEMRALGSGNAPQPMSVEELLRTGAATIDEAETEVAKTGFFVWPGRQYRISIRIDNPLADRIYDIVWKLPEDEFAILPNAEDFENGHNPLLRTRVSEAIVALRDRVLHSAQIGPDHNAIIGFLERCGQYVLSEFHVPGWIRVDLAVLDDDRIRVAVGVQGGNERAWTVSPLTLHCAVGETLRGKAFLQREVLHFSPGSRQTQKDPQRLPEELAAKRQLSIPLVFPPDLPYYPRIGVLTFSWDAGTWTAEVQEASDKVLTPDSLRDVFSFVHSQLLAMSESMQIRFPEVFRG